MADSPPFAPWIIHKNSSTTSLSRLGLEKTVPPGQSDTRLPLAENYQHKKLPPIPNVPGERKRRRPLSSQSLRIPDSKVKRIVSPHPTHRINERTKPHIGSKSHSFPKPASRPLDNSCRRPSPEIFDKPLPPPPRPPMTKSAQKILQLTGFDPSFDEEPRSHYSVPPESSTSSGSQYSQSDHENENENQDYESVIRSHWESISMGLKRDEPSGQHLKSSTNITSEKSTNVSELPVASVVAAFAPVPSLRYHDRVVKEGSRQRDMAVEDPEHLINNQLTAAKKARYEGQRQPRFDDGFERDDGSRYSYELAGPDRTNLVPKPLAVRTKPRVSAETSKLEHYYATPVSPTGCPHDGTPANSQMPLSPIPKWTDKGSFESGKAPLKTSFPFSSSQRDSGTGKSEMKFSMKLSGALKRLSGGMRPPIRQNIITNQQREPNGPDTPMPLNFGFKSLLPSPDLIQKGNGHLLNAVEKAKKGLKIKTADEKRREDLKKHIVVVGVVDQSSDGKVSEWL